MKRHGGSGLLNHSSAIAWTILALSVVVTIAASLFSHHSVQQAALTRFDAKTDDIKASIRRRIVSQKVALWGGVGLFEALGEVSRAQWRDYAETLKFDRNLPGLQGFGYAEMIAPGELSSHTARIRAEGFADYRVYPGGSRDIYSSIIFLEPFRGRNLRAFGYDMFSEPTRRTAMEFARDTGTPGMSGMVTLVQETDRDVQHGFLVYLPVYRRGLPRETIAERRAALQGFIYSPYRIGDLMEGILGKEDAGIHFHIYDGGETSPAKLMYDSSRNVLSLESTEAQFTKTSTLWHGDHAWTLEFRSRPGFVASSEENQPIVIAAAGLLIDALLFLTISSLGSQRRRALEMAEAMTKELRMAKAEAEKLAQQESHHRRKEAEARRRLQTANEGLKQFTSAVAHDLRAPLKRIESFVSILQEEYAGKMDGDGRDILQRIERGSSRMTQLLESLHNYARLSRVSITGKVANVAQTARHAADSLAAGMEGAAITYAIEDSLHVRGDRLLLQQVLQNLIANSVKFRGTMPPAIVVAAERMDGSRVRISVSDNGIGIESRYARKVFEMFARLHSDDEYPGTGIGLAVCKKIVSDHGGEIFVDTTYTGGTRIVILLDEMVSRSAADRAVAA